MVQEWEDYYEMRFARKPKLVRNHVESRPGVAWVPAPPNRLVGRSWPTLRAAWAMLWR